MIRDHGGTKGSLRGQASLNFGRENPPFRGGVRGSGGQRGGGCKPPPLGPHNNKYGASALPILAALAATSFVVWKRRLGKNWKRLQQLIYLAVLLVVVHFAWARKGNLTTLSGDVALPLAVGVAAVILLTLRLPAVRRWISARRRAFRVGSERPPPRARRDYEPPLKPDPGPSPLWLDGLYGSMPGCRIPC